MNYIGKVALSLSLAVSGLSSAQSTPFTDYVAMGDSITAGVQSAGLTSTSQMDSYAVLLGQRGGLSVVPPLTQDPGCPPPIGSSNKVVNCERLNPDAATNVVAVPGSKAGDILNSTDTQVEDPDPVLYDPRVYKLVLGPGKKQIDAALERKPKFITLWVGSNDVLLDTLRGTPDKATPPAEFKAYYAQILDRLVPSGAKIVVLTVPDVTEAPALLPVSLLRLGGLVDSSCFRQNVFFGNAALIGITKEKPLSCLSEVALTRAEYNAAQATVDAYNVAIRELAAARGIAVFDVNPLLKRLPGRSLFPTGSYPFGPSVSKDGIHPSSSTHEKLAQALAKFINAQFGTALNTRY